MANKKIGVVLALDGQKEFSTGMKNANQQAQLLKSQLKQLAAEYEGEANSMAALSAKQSKLVALRETYRKALETAKKAEKDTIKSQEEQSKKLEELKKAQTEANKAFEQVQKTEDKSSKAYRDAEKAVENCNKAVRKQENEVNSCNGVISKWQSEQSKATTAIYKLDSELAENEKYMKEAANSADNCAKSIDEFGNKVKDSADEVDGTNGKFDELGEGVTSLGDIIKGVAIGDILSEGIKKLGEYAVEAAKYIVEVGSTFEASMSKVEAVSGASAAELQQISDTARELGSSTKFSASEVADAFSYMSLAGWSTAEMLDGITGVVNLAAAADMDLANASDMVTDYLSAFGMAASDAAKMADMMANAQASSNTSAEQLGEAYSNCATNLHNAGQSIEDVTALLEGMANVGDKGSSAGTALSAVMAQITKNMEDGAIAIGDTKVQVQDAEGNFRSLIDIMKDVSGAVDGMGSAEQAAALSMTFNRTSLAGVNEILAAGVDNIKNYSEQLSNCDGAAQSMADTMQNNLQGKLTELGSATEGLGITIYSYISGPLTGAVEFLTGAINTLNAVLTPTAEYADTFITEAEAALEVAKAASGNSDQLLSEAESTARTIDILGKGFVQNFKAYKDGDISLQQFKGSLQAIGKYVPEITSAFDEQTGVLNLTERQVSAYIDSAIQTTKLDGATESLQGYSDAIVSVDSAIESSTDGLDALSNRTELLKDFSDTVSQMETNMDEYGNVSISTDSLQAIIDKLDELHGAGVLSEDDFNSMKSEFEALATSLNPLDDGLNICSRYLTTTGYASDETASNIADLNEQTEQLTQGQEEAADAVDKLSAAQADANAEVEAANKEAEILNKFYEATNTVIGNLIGTTKDFTDSNSELVVSEEEVVEATEEATTALSSLEEAQKNAADSIKSTYEDLRSSLEESMKSKISLFDMFDGGTDMTVEKMLENLKSQTAGITEWKDNLSILSNEIGTSITPEFYDYIVGMGVEGANAVRHMVITLDQANGRELLQEMCNEYTSAMNMSEGMAESLAATQLAIESGLGKIGSTDVKFDELYNNIKTAIENGGGEFGSLWQGIDDDFKENLTSMIQDAKVMGIEIPEGLADGILEGSISPESALDQITGSMTGWASEALKIAETAGFNIPEDIASGIEAGGEQAVTAYKQLIEYLAGTDFSDTMKTAGESGVNAYTEGVRAGAEDSKAAGEEVKNETEAAVADAETAMSTSGESAGQAYADGISGKSVEASNAAQTLSEAVKKTLSNTASINAAGSSAGVAYAAGILKGTTAVSIAASTLSSVAINSMSTAGFGNVGLNISLGVANGILSGGSYVANAARSIISTAMNAMTAAAQIHSPSRLFREKVGQQITAGAALGISDKASLAGKSATEMSNKVYKAAVSWLAKYKESQAVAIQDEAWYWQQVLKHCKQGTAAYGSAYKQMISAQSRMLSQSTGLSQGITKQIASNFGVDRYSYSTKTTTKKGKTTTTTTKTKKDDATYYSEIYSAAQKYMEQMQVLNNVSLSDQLKYWQNVKAGLKDGTDAWYDATKKINDIQEDIQEEYKKSLQDKVDDYDDYIRKLQIETNTVADNNTLLKGFQRVLEEIEAAGGKYSDAWYEAKEKINGYLNDIADEAQEKFEEKISNIMSTPDDLAKEFYVMNGGKEASNLDMLTMWQSAVQQLEGNGKKFSDEWITAMTNVYKYMQAWESEIENGNSTISEKVLSTYQGFYKMSSKASAQYYANVIKYGNLQGEALYETWQKALESNEEYYEQRRELDEQYAEDSKSINDSLIENVDELKKAYDDAVKSRENDILSQMSLFSDWDSESESGTKLLYNLQTQVAGLAAWSKELEQLEGRGILSSGLMGELKNMGPDAAASIYAINTLTDEQLVQYNKLYEDKLAYAHSQAVKDNADLLSETNDKIAELQEEAVKALSELTDKYLADLDEIEQDVSEALIETLSSAFKNGDYEVGADWIYRNLKTYMGQYGEGAKYALYDAIGNLNLAEELGSGALGDSLRLVSEDILPTADELKIVEESGTIVADTWLNSILERIGSSDVLRDAMTNTYTKLRDEANSLNYNASGDMNASASSSMTSENTSQAASFNSAVNTMTQAMGSMIQILSGMKVVLDTGEVVGVLTQPIMDSMAQEIGTMTDTRW